MDLLTAVNNILPKLGEHPVTRLDATHPTLAIILPEIDMQLRAILLKGWWFNQNKITLYPDSENKITLGTDVLDFLPDAGYVAQRGQALYNAETGTYEFTSSVQGVATYYVPFDDLPESAALYVLYTSLVLIYGTDIGLEAIIQLWAQQAQEALKTMTATHLRNKRYSTRDTRAFRRIRASLRG